jgi:macrolide-specific efflux system membrane fusion protein
VSETVLAPGPPTGQLPALGAPGPERPGPWWRRRWVLAGAAVVLAAGAGVGIWLGTSGGSPPSTGAHVTTEVVRVTKGTMKQTVSASGTIEPAQVFDLDFATAGTVDAVDVAVGDKVTVGQTLATVSTTALAAQEAAAQASLTAATSRLDTDEAQGASASQIASDEEAVTSARDQLTTAKKALAAADLTSPIAGTVSSVDLTVGEVVAGTGLGTGGHGGGTSGGSSGSSQVVVESTDTFVVNTSVDDTEVSQIAVGDQAVITPTGSQTPVYGTVASVGMLSTSSGGVPSFPVTIDVTGNPSGVYAGSGSQISIIVKELTTVVEVPTSAISYSGGQASVTVVEPDGHHQRVPVTLGTTENGETQVVRGVHTGEKIEDKVVTFTAPTGARIGTKGPAGVRIGPGGPVGPGGSFHSFIQTGAVKTGIG